MPNAMTVQKINMALTAESVRALAEDAALAEQFSRPGSLVDVASSLLELSDQEIEYLRAIPSALQEAARASIADAVSNGKAVQVQYSPAYDFEVRVWDFGEAISLHISGPYPRDFTALTSA